MASEAREYEYAIVRVVPSMERGEFANVGLLMSGIDVEYLEFRPRRDLARYYDLWQEVDWAMVEQHLSRIGNICCGPWPDSDQQLRWRNRFQWLVAPKSALIQCSEVHGGWTCLTLEAEMDRLALRYL